MNKKLLADIVAIAGAMIGSLTIALNLGYNMIGYIAFLISGIGTIYLLRLCNASNSLKFIAYFYLIVNVVGVIRYGA